MGIYYDSSIPDAAHQFVVTAASAGKLAVMAFTPTGTGWVGVTTDGVYQAQGIPQDCFNQLVQYIDGGAKVDCIAFSPGGGWVIIAGGAYRSSGIPQDCFDMIVSFSNNGWPISCVAFPPGGGDSWVVLGPTALYARNIDDECFQYLNNYTQGSRRVSQVVFPPAGGWLIYGSGGYFFARNIDDNCYAQVTSIQNSGWVVDHVAFTAAGGFSIAADGQNPYTQPDPLRTFELSFFQNPNGTWASIWDRMTHWGVPGASVAFVLNDATAWRTSYGLLKMGGTDRVYTGTPFQAGSVSKPLAAAGVVLLDQKGSVALGDPIQNHTTWTIPYRSCCASAWVEEATIELALQHKSGIIGRGSTNPLNSCSSFTAGGGGFVGYENASGVTVPTLDEVLAGDTAYPSTVNSPKIELSNEPGTYYYSGMGFVVLMRMLQDVTRTDFASWMLTNVLTPMGMSGSTYAIVLPQNLSRAAAGHDTNENPITGDRNRYPESPAAGLYTNAGDLCQYIIMLNQQGKVNGQQVLDTNHASMILSDQLGIFTATGIGPTAKQFSYNHLGENVGFTAFIQGYPNQGAGMAVMVNRDNGDVANSAGTFCNEVVAALQRVYNVV